jgi:microcystin degradation protein MlrC
VVVTGDDEPIVLAAANELAAAYWDAREDFKFVAPTGSFAECLIDALSSHHRPFVISDSGDNPTAGGAGDASHCLHQLMTTPELLSGSTTAVYAAIFDPQAVQIAMAAGVGATVTVLVGGHVDTLTPPVEVTAEVAAIQIDNLTGVQVVALRVGGLTFLVTSRRKQFDKVISWTAVGVDPREADLVIVKLGYLEPEIYSLAADWRLALTPGGVDQDLHRLAYAHLKRPLYPFDPAMPVPSLTAKLL